MRLLRNLQLVCRGVGIIEVDDAVLVEVGESQAGVAQEVLAPLLRVECGEGFWRSRIFI